MNKAGDSSSLPDLVDGCTGERAIAYKYREVYMKIYTENESVEEVLKIKDRIERLIT